MISGALGSVIKRFGKVFSVLRFSVGTFLSNPYLYWDKNIKKERIMEELILHKMTVECTRERYTSRILNFSRKVASESRFLDETETT